MVKNIFAALGIVLSIFFIVIASPALGDEPTPYFIDTGIIPRITCPTGDGENIGTGTYVGSGVLLTAHHVIETGGCSADKRPIVQLAVKGQQPGDYAIMFDASKDAPDQRALLNCNGFEEGHHYFATGYALGVGMPVTQRLLASSEFSTSKGFEGETIFRGSVTQGMSGGPIVDDDGALVGIINANRSYGVTVALGLPISATPLCKSGK